ncbi:unnamed protein product [marine sediment metagenome]|uniref:Uncharacterized protein n=1 Tax=marine sediment metagenome TaxID=412755 RepID=X1AEQ8_9ZZZZ
MKTILTVLFCYINLIAGLTVYEQYQHHIKIDKQIEITELLQAIILTNNSSLDVLVTDIYKEKEISERLYKALINRHKEK